MGSNQTTQKDKQKDKEKEKENGKHENIDFKKKIPLYTTEGVKDVDITNHPFQTEDGLGLYLTRFLRSHQKHENSKDVIIIIHGLTTSTDMFIQPEHYNLVSYLLDNNYPDVWTLDYRMSNRHFYNCLLHRYNMDDIALYDHPAALRTVRSVVGEDTRIHIICHCLGSVSFLMSLFAKQVNVTSVIANSVGLTPRVPAWSKFKLCVSPFAVESILGQPYVSPNWSFLPICSMAKLFAKLVNLAHRECDVPACHMLSMMWGTGFPALYEHKNLSEITHRRGGDLYGPTSMHYYRHVRKMVFAKSTAVKMDPKNPKYRDLPNNYFEYAAEIETPLLLVTGERNHVFTDSNIELYRRLEQIVPGRHSLHVFPGYGHQDVFMGENVAEDIFPTFLDFLKKHSK